MADVGCPCALSYARALLERQDPAPSRLADVGHGRFEDEVEASRGDTIARPYDAPKPSHDIDAMNCWMTTEPLHPRRKLAIEHTARVVQEPHQGSFILIDEASGVAVAAAMIDSGD